jgi:hypothetical protein
MDAEFRIFEDDDISKEHYQNVISTGDTKLDAVLNSKPTTTISGVGKGKSLSHLQRMNDKQTDTAFLSRRREFCQEIFNLVQHLHLGTEVQILSQSIFVNVTEHLRKMHNKTRLALCAAAVFTAATAAGCHRSHAEIIHTINSGSSLCKAEISQKHYNKALGEIKKYWKPVEQTVSLPSDANASIARRVCNMMGLSPRIAERCARECKALSEKCEGRTARTITACALTRVLTAANVTYDAKELYENCQIRQTTVVALMKKVANIPVQE